VESREEDPLLKKSHIGVDGNSENEAQKKMAIIHRHPDFMFAVYDLQFFES
jgi:hypothetical protein